jgi:hypothetical protein
MKLKHMFGWCQTALVPYPSASSTPRVYWTSGLQHSPSSAVNLHHTSKPLQAWAGQRLCERICDVVVRGAINEGEGPMLDMESDEVISQVDVFGA